MESTDGIKRFLPPAKRLAGAGSACRNEKGEGSEMINLKDGSPITNVGDDEEDVLGDEGIIGIGTDSSAGPQNDNLSGNDLRGYRGSW